ncbi:MAG: hypothetical protein DHS20C15_06010 [Planctomycetota bacterium]|nr:MAG: hypothetical protein DHS20C15_06010 [Planctomycetota bacterium]
MSSISSRRRLACVLALTALASLGGLGIACGDDAPAEPDTTARLAVLQRDLSLERDPSAPAPQPFSYHWDAASLRTNWLPGEGTLRKLQTQELQVRGTPNAELVSPASATLDAEIHHHLVVHLRSARALDVTVYWRAREAQPFAESRRTVAETLPASEATQIWSLPLANLRGWKHQREGGPGAGWTKGADAAEGLQALRLVFVDAENPGSTPADVFIESIALTSSFDRESDQELSLARMGREHVFQRGVALSVPDAASLSLMPGPQDRLRFSLAVAGAREPVTLSLRDEAGKLAPQSWELQPRAPWLNVALELGALAGENARLHFETSGAQSGGAVMIGQLMHLAPPTTPRPNVVLYVEDTLRADRLPSYGYALPTAPHLSRMADAGVVFEDLFAASNWTRPSTTSLLTALDPVTHGNHDDYDRIAESLVTLPELLAEAGYVTASLVTNYHAGAWSGLDQGFDVVHEPPAGGASTLNSTLTSGVVGDALEALLEEHQGEQLFVYAHSLDPHQPYTPTAEDLRVFHDPPEGAAGTHKQASPSVRYDAEILFNDHQLARLDAQLESHGLLEDTLFVFTSDHGEGFMEHGQRSHRTDMFQEELHVPWILRWPAQLRAGQRVSAPAGHVDIAPTLAGLLGLDAPSNWRGRDLSQLARSPNARVDATPLMSFTTYGTRPEGGHKQALAVRQGAYKLTAWVNERDEILPRALYRLDLDPGEHTNLLEASEHAEQRDRMLSWARDDLARGRASVEARPANHMDPAMRAWLQEMGYLGK